MTVITDAPRSVLQRTEDLVVGLAVLAGFVGILVLSYQSYGLLDSLGVVSHQRTIEVQLKPDWMVGEMRQCNSWYLGATVDGLNCVGSNNDAALQGHCIHCQSSFGAGCYESMHRKLC